MAAAALDRAEPLQLMRVTARLPVSVNRLRPREGRRAAAAPEARAMKFNGHPAATLPAHAWEHLNVGDEVRGPALVNGATLTCPVPPQWSLLVDDYGNAVLTRAP